MEGFDLTMIERFGVSVTLLVALALGAAYVLKRLIGEEGIVTTLSRSVGPRLVKFFDAIEDVTAKTASLQEKMIGASELHHVAATAACKEVTHISRSNDQIMQAGLHACDLLENLQSRVGEKAFEPHLSRIRSALEQKD